MMDKILREGESEENLSELYTLLRPALFVLKSGLRLLYICKGDKIRSAFFTRLKKCQKIINQLDEYSEPYCVIFFNMENF